MVKTPSSARRATPPDGKSSGKPTLQAAAHAHQPPLFQVLEGIKQLQTEVRQLRVSVSRQAHVIKVLQQGWPTRGDGATHGSVSRADQGLADMRVRLGLSGRNEADVDAEFEQGSEAAKASWIRDGLLVGSVELSGAWSRSRQALEQACERGDLFNLKIARRRWYCAEFLSLAVDDVKAVCHLLQGLDPVTQFIFWNRPHGALSGQTPALAIHGGKLPALLHAAEAFASERTGHAPA